MGSNLSVSQILHNQAKSRRELDEVRKELAVVRDNEVLDAEVRRLNRSPYVNDRTFHKIQTLKGSQEELDWKKNEIEERISDYASNSPKIDAETLQALRIQEAQIRAERLIKSKNSAEFNLKKLDII